MSKKTSKFFGLLLIIFSSGLILILLAYFFKLALKPADVAGILTAENTVFYLNAEFTLGNLNKLQKLDKNTAFELARSREMFDQYFAVDFKKEIAPWLGTSHNFALVQIKKNLFPILFFQITDKKQTRAFLEKQKLPNSEQIIDEKFGSFTISEFQLGQKIIFSFYKNYLVITDDKEALKSILTDATTNLPKLNQNPKYIEIRGNLPVNRLAFAWLDFSRIPELMNGLLLNRENQQLRFLKPIFDIFPAHAATLTIREKGLLVSTYSKINKNTLKNPRYFAKAQKFKPILPHLLDTDTVYFLSGLNLSAQFQKILQISKEKTPVIAPIIEAALRSFKSQYFAENISLENDIYPLFEDEFLFAISRNKENQTVYSFVQKLSRLSSASTVLKIKDQFIEKNALFEPFVVEEEAENFKPRIKTPLGMINEVKSEYNGADIYSLIIPGLDQQLHLSVSEGLLFFSTDKEKIISLIDQMKKSSLNETEKLLTMSLIKKIISVSDEISFLNFKATELPKKSFYNFLPLSFVFSGNNVFDDGIVTQHYIRFVEQITLKEEVTPKKYEKNENQNSGSDTKQP